MQKFYITSPWTNEKTVLILTYSKNEVGHGGFVEKHYYEVIDYWLQNLSGISRNFLWYAYDHSYGMGLLTKQVCLNAINTYAIGHLLPRILLNIFSLDICSSEKEVGHGGFCGKTLLQGNWLLITKSQWH
jgi:hypothetical protein